MQQIFPYLMSPHCMFYSQILFSDLPGQEIEFEVLDKNVQRDDSLGSCKIAVPHVLKKKFIDKWIRLDNVKSGELHIKVETLKLFSDRDKLQKVKSLFLLI
ncbi:extended synaptotagmin-2-like [Xenopus laevis]|uniref:Extended synaptotagmin-2-like n=1 Tax=Xenopus laevis TaxID=8355 RepID=A0A8J1KKD9_XENLA|nr:extended synaptotagmin-2-like [Xenopus laevis]